MTRRASYRPPFRYRVRRWVRRIALLALLLGLLVLAAVLREWNAPTRVIAAADGRAIHVADGDSFSIGTDKLRLTGMDAVEYRQFCTDRMGQQWSCGVAAADALRTMLAEGDVRCSGNQADRFGRLLVQCQTARTDDVAGAMVQRGWAVSENPRGAAPYADEQGEAEAARRGIWAGAFMRPRDWRDAKNVHPVPVDR